MKIKIEQYAVDTEQGTLNVGIARLGINSAMVAVSPMSGTSVRGVIIRPVIFTTNLDKDLLSLLG
jgi:hypothetical protein